MVCNRRPYKLATLLKKNLRSIIALGCALAIGPALGADLGTFNARIDALVKDASGPQQIKPPTDGPTAAKNKNIVIIPCSMAAEGCARQARAAEEAAKVIGWRTTLIDPAGDITKMASAVQKAIDLRADGIVFLSIDARIIQGPLAQAKQAGLKLVAQGENIDNLYDSEIPWQVKKFFFDQGYTVAAAGYVFGDRKLHMLMLRDDEFIAAQYRAEGALQFVNDCIAVGGDCKLLASENFLVNDLTTTLPKQAVALVRRFPNYNVLWVAYDAALNFVIQQGLREADLLDTGFTVGFDANVANAELMRTDRYQQADLGFPLEWMGWGLIDQMNRALNGKDPNVDEGIRSRLLNKETLPSDGSWQGDVDFRTIYKRVWGVQ
jgi:ribose transport system substrate-binding protein